VAAWAVAVASTAMPTASSIRHRATAAGRSAGPPRRRGDITALLCLRARPAAPDRLASKTLGSRVSTPPSHATSQRDPLPANRQLAHPPFDICPRSPLPVDGVGRFGVSGLRKPSGAGGPDKREAGDLESFGIRKAIAPH